MTDNFLIGGQTQNMAMFRITAQISEYWFGGNFNNSSGLMRPRFSVEIKVHGYFAGNISVNDPHQPSKKVSWGPIWISVLPRNSNKHPRPPWPPKRTNKNASLNPIFTFPHRRTRKSYPNRILQSSMYIRIKPTRIPGYG